MEDNERNHEKNLEQVGQGDMNEQNLEDVVIEEDKEKEKLEMVEWCVTDINGRSTKNEKQDGENRKEDKEEMIGRINEIEKEQDKKY